VSTFDLLQTFGLPLGMLLAALLLGSRRVWVWGKELTDCEARGDEMRADYEKRLEDQREAHLRRERELADATERWQQLFMSTLPALRGLTEAVKTSAEKMAER
jgi:hypothetical protein